MRQSIRKNNANQNDIMGGLFATDASFCRVRFDIARLASCVGFLEELTSKAKKSHS